MEGFFTKIKSPLAPLALLVAVGASIGVVAVGVAYGIWMGIEFTNIKNTLTVIQEHPNFDTTVYLEDICTKDFGCRADYPLIDCNLFNTQCPSQIVSSSSIAAALSANASFIGSATGPIGLTGLTGASGNIGAPGLPGDLMTETPTCTCGTDCPLDAIWHRKVTGISGSGTYYCVDAKWYSTEEYRLDMVQRRGETCLGGQDIQYSSCQMADRSLTSAMIPNDIIITDINMYKGSAGTCSAGGSWGMYYQLQDANNGALIGLPSLVKGGLSNSLKYFRTHSVDRHIPGPNNVLFGIGNDCGSTNDVVLDLRASITYRNVVFN